MNWEAGLAQLHGFIKEGQQIIKSGNPHQIAELRYKLAMWRAYVGAEYAKFDTEYASEKMRALESDEKGSVSRAETVADSLPVSLNRTTAKELLETLTQLSNACGSAITVLSKEAILDK